MASGKNRIGIVGLGLIGGSIARALKKSGKDYVIFANDQDEEALKEAQDIRIIDKQVTVKDGFSECDIIFLCIPVNKMEEIIKDLIPGLSPQCILTDVGSTKGEVVSLIKEMKLDDRFIGGHPLTGSEKSGFSSSKANLFENAYYCITPTDKTSDAPKEYLKSLVKDMGAIPFEIVPEEHDRVAAVISHIPHVVAALLVNMVGSLDNSENTMKTIAAGGFKDVTRIASSSPELWAGICFSNRYKILDILSTFENGLKNFENNLKAGEKEKVQCFFNSARNLRDTFSERKSLIQKTFDISVDVDDRPGIIAVIASALAKRNINIKNIGILNNRENEEGALEIQFENEESRSQGIETLHHLGYTVKRKG